MDRTGNLFELSRHYTEVTDVDHCIHIHVINLPVCVDIAHRLSLAASNLFTLLVHCSDGYLAWLYLYKDKYALRNCMKCIPTKRVYIT